MMCEICIEVETKVYKLIKKNQVNGVVKKMLFNKDTTLGYMASVIFYKNISNIVMRKD